jgi:catechol 2,3-dioxygenase-like lactoylglutathione lyase family enzyme
MTQIAPVAPTEFLSHGTLESRDLTLSKRFYKEFLGIGCVRHCEPAANFHHGGDWIVVCVGVGGQIHPQGRDYRWCLDLATPEVVDEARQRAIDRGQDYGVQEIGPVEEADGVRSFVLRDLDGNWWELAHRPEDYFERKFAAPGDGRTEK